MNYFSMYLRFWPVVGAVIQAPILRSSLRSLIPQKIFTKHYVWGIGCRSSILFGLFMVQPISAVLLSMQVWCCLFRCLLFKRLEMSILAHMLRNGVAVLIMILTGLVNGG